MLLGAAFGALILLGFRRTRFPIRPPPPRAGRTCPPRSGATGRSRDRRGLEFCALIWAPEFLERVAGLPRATAAASAGAFSLAMLLGRPAPRPRRRFAAQRLFLGAFLLTLLGFAVYWGSGPQLATVAGLFILGLGVAPLYPLSLGFAIGVAGARRRRERPRHAGRRAGDPLDTRFAWRLGRRGGAALGSPHSPGLVVAALLSLGIARALERRSLACRGGQEA